jgi:gamma-glutamyltranspeptidase / glutathione hydrolase
VPDRTVLLSELTGAWGARVRLAGLGLVLALGAACASMPDLLNTNRWAPPTAGAVVSEHPLATNVGIALLDAGGNAVDAAVGTALALAVVYPQAGNLGGGGFAIWVQHDPEVEPRALDFRESSPAALRPTDFLDDEGLFESQRFLASPLIVGIPGSPAGLHELHKAGGRLSWNAVIQPAIDLARKGYSVDRDLAFDLREDGLRERLEANVATRLTYYPQGQPLGEGQLLKQPDLARTLERLRDEGPNGFYRGSVAQAILNTVGVEAGGRFEAADLETYTPRWLTPLRGGFRGREVITMPPPSSGGLVLLQVLAMLDGMPLDAERDAAKALVNKNAGTGLVADREAAISVREAHWWIEAMRRAFADRAQEMGDPDFWPVPVEQLLSPEWIAQRRISISEQAAPNIGPWERPPAESGGETTHLSVLDADGNAVSMTTTLNTTFGTGITVAGAGFLLNNELDDFAIMAGVPNNYGLVGSQANALEPGKRPLSSMTPTVIRDQGEVVTMVIGSPGGPRIITSVIEVILRTLVHNQDIQTAVNAPRLHQQWSPVSTDFEPGWEADALPALRGRGHEVVQRDFQWASVQAIRTQIGGRPVVASDPRRGGTGRVQAPKE